MTERSKRIGSYDREFVWHPFTQMKEYEERDPIIIERAEGCRLTDSEGNSYIDGVSSLWVNVHGHGVEEIDEAIKKQVDLVSHSTLLGVTNPPAAELAKEIADICPPGLKKVFYSGDGASAVEAALKMAFQYWAHKGRAEKKAFLCLDNGYHGDTLGAVSVGGIDVFHKTFEPLLFKTFRAPSYYCYRCPLGKTWPGCGIACADEAGKILEKHGAEIAAVILEPCVQAAGGMIVAPDGYLRRIREHCGPPRRAHDSGRGGHRLREDGKDVRLRARRRLSGHHGSRKGDDGRVSSAFGHRDHGEDIRGVSRKLRGVQNLFSRSQLRRKPPFVRGGDGEPRGV